MSRRTVGNWEERDALMDLKDAEDSLYAAGAALLRARSRDPIADDCGDVAKTVGKLISRIEERGKKR